MSDHSHAQSDIEARIDKSGKQKSYLKDFIYGAVDGTVTTFAIVSGVAGAGLSQNVIIALGVANVLADGFSMAAGNYLGTRSEALNHRKIVETETRHIRDFPSGERSELRYILKQHGLTGSDLTNATSIISRHKPLWISLMLSGEYGLSPMEPRPFAAAIATFCAFVLCGMVPLVPFVFFNDHSYTIASIATVLIFLAIGAIKSHWSAESPWMSALQTLLIGGAAAVIAYCTGALIAEVM